MQDPSSMAFQSMNQPQFPEHEQLKCPRCDSTNTKFCYYNNYNLSQPRHFCKNCRRYWTKGGALRNIPVGGGTRKNSKRNNSNTKRANPDPNPDPERTVRQQLDKASELGQDPTRNEDEKVMDVGGVGSFSSLLMTNGEFRSVFDGLSSSGSGLKLVQIGGFDEDLKSGLDLDSDRIQGRGDGKNSDSHVVGGGDSEVGYLQNDDWSGASNGWPDLAIYTTPGSGFQ